MRLRIDQKFRVVLEHKVREIFRQVSFKTQVLKLTDNYELVLVETSTDGESVVAPSTGENQILSLSFIGSIIERVRYWSKKYSLIGLNSSSFPIVMDCSSTDPGIQKRGLKLRIGLYSFSQSSANNGLKPIVG